MRTFLCCVPALATLVLSLGVAAPARADGPTAEQVGDPDSFGRSVIYLGRAQTPDFELASGCDPNSPFPPRCILPSGGGSFDLDDLAVVELPPGAARSLVCFTITPFLQFEFNNPSEVRADSMFRVNADVSVENEVLNDPLLIDRVTRMPYGGRMNFVFRLHDEWGSLAPGEREGRVVTTSRTCFGGFANRRDLIAAGLSETQADEFFRKPIRLVFGMSGNAAALASGFIAYGVRVYGDR
jgi:hypothetical protein